MAPHVHASTVDPEQLVAALETVGYQRAHRQPGAGGYVRLARPGETPPRGSLLIPTDRTAGDYVDLMASVVGDLEDVAQRGEDAATVLSILAGRPRPVPDEPEPLDNAMHTVFMDSGKWRWTTGKMTTEEREAAVAACMRYDRWLCASDGRGPNPRSHFVWWD